jgi:hypothetical protein
VSGNDGQLWVGQFAVDNVEIGPADAAGFNPDAHLAGPGDRIGQFLEDQRGTGLVEHHAKHCGLFP